MKHIAEGCSVTVTIDSLDGVTACLHRLFFMASSIYFLSCIVFGQLLLKWFALCYRTIVLSVLCCNVGVL